MRQRVASIFCAIGDWFEDAVYAKGWPDLPKPFFRVAKWCWTVEEWLVPRPDDDGTCFICGGPADLPGGYIPCAKCDWGDTTATDTAAYSNGSWNATTNWRFNRLK